MRERYRMRNTTTGGVTVPVWVLGGVVIPEWVLGGVVTPEWVLGGVVVPEWVQTESAGSGSGRPAGLCERETRMAGA